MTISLEHDLEIVGKAVYRVSHQTTFTNAVHVAPTLAVAVFVAICLCNFVTSLQVSFHETYRIDGHLTIKFARWQHHVVGRGSRLAVFVWLQVVSTRMVSSLLAACGHKYTVQSIIQSELRVLKTLQYRLMISTPLVYVETLLAVLGLILFSVILSGNHLKLPSP